MQKVEGSNPFIRFFRTSECRSDDFHERHQS